MLFGAQHGLTLAGTWEGVCECVCVCVCVCVFYSAYLDLTSEVVLFKNNKILQNKVWNYLSCVTLPATSVSLRKEIIGISELILGIPVAVKLFKMIQLIQKLISENKFTFIRPHIINIPVYIWKLIIQLA